MKKTILSAALACVMLMSACARPEKNGDEAVDLGEGIVLSVGENKINAAQFEFFLDDIKNQMQGTELSDDASWETTEIEGKKAIDIAKERAYESAVQYLSCIEIGKSMKLEYTDEDRDSLKKQINEEYFEQYEDSEGLISLMCESIFYMNKLQERMLDEVTVGEDEISAYFAEHKEELEGQYMRAKHVLLLTQNTDTGEKLSDGEVAEKKKQADSILSRAKSGEDFDSLVSQYSEDPGSQSEPDGYVFTSGEMMQEFEDCVKSLKNDEIGFAETSYGYHIIKRLALDEESCKSTIESAIYLDKFKQYIEEQTEKYNIEIYKNAEEYDKIK